MSSLAASFHHPRHRHAVSYLTKTELILKAHRAATSHLHLHQAVDFAPRHLAASLRHVDIVGLKGDENQTLTDRAPIRDPDRHAEVGHDRILRGRCPVHRRRDDEVVVGPAVLLVLVPPLDTGVARVHREAGDGGGGARVTVVTAATVGAGVGVEPEVGTREAEGRPLGGHPCLYTKGGPGSGIIGTEYWRKPCRRSDN